MSSALAPLPDIAPFCATVNVVKQNVEWLSDDQLSQLAKIVEVEQMEREFRRRGR